MKPTYFLGIDAAKHKICATLSNRSEQVLFEKDLSVEATGLRQLLAAIKRRVNDPEQLLVLIEATGLLHLNWSAALTKAGYAVAVINPLIGTIGLLHGEKLLVHYRFSLRPEQFTLQRAQSVRKALRSALTNLKKTYQSLMDLSFPELGGLLQLDGVGIRQLLIQAPTPAAIAGKRLSTLENNWMVRPKAAALKALAADSMADPDLAAASGPALVALLQSVAAMEARLHALDQQIAKLACTSVDPQTKALIETIPGFGPVNAAKTLAWLPTEILHSGSNRKVAARLQAFMGNDPRLRQSGQCKGHTKMSKRGVEMLRTAFFQSAFSAAHNDPELRAYYQCKRAQGKTHQVALSHLMRILTRRLVAVLRSGKPYQSHYNLKNAA